MIAVAQYRAGCSPALGVEAVRNIPAHDRGAALGVYTAFVDLSLGISGPMAGIIVSALGYPPIFLFAAAMAGSSMALLITLYLKRAKPHNTANVLSSASSRNVMTWRGRRPIRPSRHARRTQ